MNASDHPDVSFVPDERGSAFPLDNLPFGVFRPPHKAARVGVAAMEVCRPLPFTQGRRPSVRGIIKNALGGLFRSKET